MATILSNCRSSFGMKCVQCSEELIAPERSEYWSDRCTCHVWHCPKCSCCFESFVFVSCHNNSMKDIRSRDDNFSSLLVSGQFAVLALGNPVASQKQLARPKRRIR